jgi:hypothetical protein
MNKIKFLSVAILSLALAGAAKAQFNNIKPDDIDQFHGRTLIVIVEKPADEVTEKLNKKHQTNSVDAYSKAIDAYNKNFADAITQYWKVSGGEIEYKTLDEANDIEDKKNYAVLFCRSVAQPDLTTSYQMKNGIMWWPDYKEVSHDKDFSSKMTVLGLALLDKFNKGPFYQVPMPDIYPTKEDLKYVLSVANAYINYRIDHRKDGGIRLDEQMLTENQPTLKDKTLLIRRDLIDKKITKVQMDKYYPNPYMIAGPDTVAKAIDEGDAKYAVAMVVPCDLEVGATGGVEYVEYVYNIEDGNILASSGVPDMPSAPSVSASVAASATKPIITKKALLDFCMYLNDEDSGSSGKKKGKK